MENVAIELDLLAEDITLNDEIDELLATFPPIAPPMDFVARVMNAVSLMPAYKPAVISPWGDLDQVMVLNDRNRLS